MAKAVVSRAGLTVTRLALGGGLLKNRYYARAVRAALGKVLPRVTVFAARKEPVQGALEMARTMADHDSTKHE
jgi:hypothetical protein